MIIFKIFLISLLTSYASSYHYRLTNYGSVLTINDQLSFRLEDRRTEVIKLNGRFLFPENQTAKPTRCVKEVEQEICLDLNSVSKLLFKQSSRYCTRVQVIGPGKSCFAYGDDQWYGGAERYLQTWPIQETKIFNEAFVTSQANSQAVLEPFWINSKGASIYVHSDVNLFVDANHEVEGSLCIYSRDTAPYQARQDSMLTYDLCQFDNPVTAHRHGYLSHWRRPTDAPDSRMGRYPIWSTWVKYKAAINQSAVLDFGQKIVDYGFKNSQLEIDDKWEVCYGSLEVDKRKFPDMPRLTQQLKDLGFRITLWVHPFINNNCLPWYVEALAEDKLVKNIGGSVETRWWNGIAGHVDFTNLKTRDWFVQRLNNTLQENGIDSVKFDAGESSFLPQLPRINVTDSFYPDQYPTHYIDTARNFGEFIEVRVGRRTQNRAVFIRMLDKDSRWGFDNGLKSLITTMFQMNLAGYSYVLPDMIGGNVYGHDKLTKELFIRWVQVNVLMTAVQFSVPPWDFDQETVDITKKVLELRERFYFVIEQATRFHTLSGEPINRPLWYIDPTDEEALKCNDEYLVSDRLLVAPVVVEGAKSRDIYLPSGAWSDVTSDPANTTVIQGKTWLRNYRVPLDKVPIFENVNYSRARPRFKWSFDG